jgi:hypothetical protein
MSVNQYPRETTAYLIYCSSLYNAKLCNQLRCPITDEWIKKIWYKYAMEYYSAIKKNENISLAGKWMKLEVIMLSQISQAQEIKYCTFLFICRT